jgi:IS30 family transposase
MKYSHLTLEQRSQIEELMSSGLSLRAVGGIVGIHASTVSRELRRNREQGRYNHVIAEGISRERRHKASTQLKKIKNQLEEKILEGLYQLWSPEQISGRLKREGILISHEAIYQYIKKKGLIFNLRHGDKKYKNKKASEAGISFIPNRVDISKRPKIVDEKARIGDWEGDTVISHNSHCALLTMVDRRSKFTIIRKVGRKTSGNLSTAIINSLKQEGLPVNTITFDNGSEFAEHQKISKKLKANIYFARPYKSCDRGLNEHTNGLIRQFLPKKFDFKDISDHEIKIIQNFLNSRPRKVLNFLAPVEVIFADQNTTAVALHS